MYKQIKAAIKPLFGEDKETYKKVKAEIKKMLVAEKDKNFLDFLKSKSGEYEDFAAEMYSDSGDIDLIPVKDYENMVLIIATEAFEEYYKRPPTVDDVTEISDALDKCGWGFYAGNASDPRKVKKYIIINN